MIFMMRSFFFVLPLLFQAVLVAESPFEMRLQTQKKAYIEEIFKVSHPSLSNSTSLSSAIREEVNFWTKSHSTSSESQFINPSTSDGVIELPERVRVALVLGSGGARGIAHIGVIEELVNAGIPIDLIVGCSVGGAIGAIYANNPDVDALKEKIWNFDSNSLFNFNYWNCRYGIYDGAYLRKVVQSQLSVENFDELQIPLVVAASDLLSGELVSLGTGEIAAAVQASCSFPFLFTPCEHNGRVFIDGGVINPVPVSIAEDLGAELIIAVDLSEPLSPGVPNSSFGVLQQSAEILFLWQNEICAKSADIVIRPRTTGVGTFGDHMKLDLYEAGKKATQELIGDIKSLIENRGLSEAPPSTAKRSVQLPIYNPTVHKQQPLK